MNPLTREWVAKAEQDYRAVELLIAARGKRITDILCFHSQQCIEKYLKARLQESGLAVPKTHDLEKLMDLLAAVEPLWQSYRQAFRKITEYAVEFRYPGQIATRVQALRSFKIAQSFRLAARGSLGLRTCNFS